MPEGADCPQPYWMCNPGMGALETGGARHAHDDLSGQAWLIIRLPAPTACDAHDQDAACVSPIVKGIEMTISQPQTGYAPVNGLKMYYEIHGQGQPLVLVHGAFSA